MYVSCLYEIIRILCTYYVYNINCSILHTLYVHYICILLYKMREAHVCVTFMRLNYTLNIHSFPDSWVYTRGSVHLFMSILLIIIDYTDYICILCLYC